MSFSDDLVDLTCPYCGNATPTDMSWAFTNKLVFCHTCCKSFPVFEDKQTNEEDFGSGGSDD